MKRAFCIMLLGLAACGGDPSFKPITTAPPGAVAELHENRANETRSIRLTQGVAMAVECTDKKSRPCSFDGTTIGDDAIAGVRKAYADLDQKVVYSNSGQQESHLDRSVFVVTAKKVGTTTINVRTGYGDVDISVEVLPP